jgi:HEAT repeats
LAAGLRATGAEPAEPELEVSLRLDKTQFETAEPIPLTAQLFNRGEVPYSVQTNTEETGAWDGFALLVTDEAGQTVPRPRRPSWQENWIGSWLTLAHHDRYQRRLFLNYWLAPPMPGRYTVVAVYTPITQAGSERRQTAAIRSTPVPFEIVLTTPTKMDVRITRLTDQIEKADAVAVDFLGFTGETAAIAPLLNSLYDDDVSIQHRAARAMAYLPDADVLATCLTALQQRGPNRTLVEWLAFVGAPCSNTAPFYLKALESPTESKRVGAVAGLRLCYPLAAGDEPLRRAVRAGVKRALASPESNVRLEAIDALEVIGDKDARDAMAVAARQDRSSRVRERAAACMMLGASVASAHEKDGSQ